MDAAIIATTRIGAFMDIPAAFAQKLVTEPAYLSTFAVLGSGWTLALLSQAPSRLVPSAVTLGMLGIIAALARGWQMAAFQRNT